MKTTNDLLEVLNEIEDKTTLNDYLANIEKYKDLNYIDYFETVMNSHNIKKNELVNASGLSRTYCYQLINGTRKPGRDNALTLCIAAHFTLAEAIRYLELLELGTLYPKNIRDSIIIYAINRELTVQETNDLLYSKNEKTLGE
ncbi:hypothetical protein SAMN02910369_00940 [Lachnospiraceae bacterium NE2001]|nr:hypothetical protein SAMN02910369_00940 [Lachnospiraceae bacterium NE2001]